MQSTLTAKSGCEGHVFVGVECSGDVAFKLIRPCRKEERLICLAAARHIWIIQLRGRCYECRQRIADHWVMETIR